LRKKENKEVSKRKGKRQKRGQKNKQEETFSSSNAPRRSQRLKDIQNRQEETLSRNPQKRSHKRGSPSLSRADIKKPRSKSWDLMERYE